MIKTIYLPDDESYARAQKSQGGQHPDTFSGVDIIDEQLKLHTGIIQSALDYGDATPANRRWRASIKIGDD